MTSNQDTHTYNEIYTQYDAWQDAQQVVSQNLEALQALTESSYNFIVVTGCGSTYYLSTIMASLLRKLTGVAAVGAPASEMILHPEQVIPNGATPLLIAISRSAATSETIMATQQFRKIYDNPVITITCYEEALVDLATVALVAKQGQEESLVQTRSFAAMLLMAESVAAILAKEAISTATLDNPTQFIERARDFARPYTSPDTFERYFYLGSGVRHGIASEATLKLQEMSLTLGHAYHPFEFRHGPKSLVDEKAVVIGFLDPNENHADERKVLDEMRAYGGTVLEISAHPNADFVLPADGASLVYCLPPLQFLAYYRAIDNGLNPDKPRNLSKVIVLD